ncbi:MAG: hypothetical protein MUO17_02380 [Dehalococcoidales bacterium]|nr:hypothetical protein [Dehalococcoidales bacterium]
MREKEYILFTPDKYKDIWGQRYWRMGSLVFLVLFFYLAGWFYFFNVPRVLIQSPNVPNMPIASDNFDCDDSALFLYEYFTSEGYECSIVVGNLEMQDETFFQCKHVWVMVTSSDGKNLAYDWGVPRFDQQHYHGFTLTPDQLKDIVALDLLNFEKSPE